MRNKDFIRGFAWGGAVADAAWVAMVLICFLVIPACRV
jgi:hypothetical protein